MIKFEKVCDWKKSQKVNDNIIVFYDAKINDNQYPFAVGNYNEKTLKLYNNDNQLVKTINVKKNRVRRSYRFQNNSLPSSVYH